MLSRLRNAALIGALIALSPSTQALAQNQRNVFHRLGPIEILGDAPSYAEVGLGAFDVFAERDGSGERSGAAQLQLRWGRKLYFIGPAIGLLGNTDGGIFGYGGIYADLAYGDFIVTPVLAAGGYSEGGSKDLGGVFQFRAELGIAYEFDDGARIGARLGHISNAGIHADNPGEEELLITFAIPFR
jgi:lipid A 3-O-deacylase